MSIEEELAALEAKYSLMSEAEGGGSMIGRAFILASSAARTDIPALAREVRLLRLALDHAPPECQCITDGGPGHAPQCIFRPDRPLGEP